MYFQVNPETNPIICDLNMTYLYDLKPFTPFYSAYTWAGILSQEFGAENLRAETISCRALWRMILTYIEDPDNWFFCGMTPRIKGMPSLLATHQVISLGPEGECHVITSTVSCHVIFATACHNSGGATLVMVFITVLKQAPVRKFQHPAWFICGELWDMWKMCKFERRLRGFIYTSYTHFIALSILIISQLHLNSNWYSGRV